MKDDLPYFSHDNDARNHPKMKALRARFGWTGYGQFWALNEMIAGAPQARLDLSRKVVRSSVACELGMTTDALDDFLRFLEDKDECGLINYSDGILTTDRTQEDYEHVTKMREQKSAAGKASALKKASNSTAVRESSTAVQQPLKKTPTAVEEWNGKNQENRAEQSREEKSSSSARADDIPRDDPGLLAYALDLAKKAKARNPGAYARTLLDKPDVIAAYRESLVLPEAEPIRAPPPKTCSECSGKITLIAGEAVCGKCGAAWTWYDDWQSWERSPESYQRVDLSALKPA